MFARMTWLADPKGDRNKVNKKDRIFTGPTKEDVEWQMRYHINKHGMIQCEIKELPNEEQSTE